ncbi:hypothetical protein NQZ68_015690 [Dissostichus eleginoides]|nr:hypothetical protein NQZ68_015690 [Dissostichus eleginoides]
MWAMSSLNERRRSANEPPQHVCPDGFYGLDCGQMCECRNGARCHHITGGCLCTAGWAGPHCILACPEGTFGERCSQTCECERGSRCDHVSGGCSCAAGLTGVRCQLREFHPQLIITQLIITQLCITQHDTASQKYGQLSP